jgi:hypothetical protein
LGRTTVVPQAMTNPVQVMLGFVDGF